MAEPLANEIGLLRTIVRNLEHTPLPVDPNVVAYLRAQGIEAPKDAGSKMSVRPAGHDAFNQLSECLITHSAAMERGVNFEKLQTELFAQLETFVGGGPEAIARGDAQKLVDHFSEWFRNQASPRKVFVPCVITPWAAPRFEIGSVTFIYIDEITRTEFYPAGPKPDVVARQRRNTCAALFSSH